MSSSCSACGEKAVMNGLCKEHFIADVEARVFECIDRFSLIKPDENVCVAVSGGKDSLTVLYILSLRYNVTALAIDEGIDGYREQTLDDLRSFCEKYGVTLRIESVKKHFGATLDTMLTKVGKDNACTTCGIARRYLLNIDRSFDVLATGHNMDDELQSFCMNMFKNHMTLIPRMGPQVGTSKHEQFLQRIKPLYFLSEKEIRAYAFLKGFVLKFTECPYAKDSFRRQMQTALNNLEQSQPGSKRAMLEYVLSLLSSTEPKDFAAAEQKLGECIRCGEPTTHEVCKACRLKESLAKHMVVVE